MEQRGLSHVWHHPVLLLFFFYLFINCSKMLKMDLYRFHSLINRVHLQSSPFLLKKITRWQLFPCILNQFKYLRTTKVILNFYIFIINLYCRLLTCKSSIRASSSPSSPLNNFHINKEQTKRLKFTTRSWGLQTNYLKIKSLAHQCIHPNVCPMVAIPFWSH